MTALGVIATPGWPPARGRAFRGEAISAGAGFGPLFLLIMPRIYSEAALRAAETLSFLR
jgi:hypothetical protein